MSAARNVLVEHDGVAAVTATTIETKALIVGESADETNSTDDPDAAGDEAAG